MQSRIKPVAIIASAALAALVFTWRAPVGAQAQPQPDLQAQVKLGDYLANNVARCGDCHTPRDAAGKLDITKNMQGSPIPYQPATKGKFNMKAPDITSTGKGKTWGEAKMITFLSTGGKADAPMPAYKMTKEDATAVVKYLLSLPAKSEK